MAPGAIEIDVLGPIRVVGDGRTLHIGGARQHALLARLLVGGGAPVPVPDLRRDVWGSSTTSDSTVRVAVKRLRGALAEGGGGDVIVHRGNGYAIDLATVSVDAVLFEREVAEGDRLVPHHPRRASRLLHRALDRWRGPPFGTLATADFLETEAGRLERLRREARTAYFAAELTSGAGPDVVTRLESAVEDDPYAEPLVALLVRALYASGRQIDALDRYRQLERRLRDDFGVLPGPELRQLQHRVLVQDPDLSPSEWSGGGATEVVGPLAHRVRALAMTPFVGREAELRTVSAVVERDDEAPVVCVSGPPGIGKSRLLAEVAQDAAQRGHLVIHLACAEDPASALQFGADLADAVGVFDPDAWAALDPMTRQTQVRREVLRELTALAGSTHVVVVVDDLHWADPETIALLAHAIERCPSGVRWVLALRSGSGATAEIRPDELLERVGAHAHVELGPLDRRSIEELATTFGRRLDDASVHRISRMSGGEPLVVSELLRDERSAPGTAVPDRLATIFRGRLEGVTPPVARLADTLGVVGDGLDTPLLAEACGLGIPELLDAAAHLSRLGLVDPDLDSGVRLRHHLIRDILGERVAPGRALRIRRRAVGVLAANGPSRALAEQLLGLATMRTPREDRLLDEAVSVGLGELLATADYGQALRLAERYVDTAGTERADRAATEALLQVATVLLACGETERGWALHGLVVERARHIGEPRLLVDALLATGPVATGDASPERVAEAEDLLERLDASDAIRRIQLRCWAAHHLIGLGDHDAALAHLDVVDTLLAQRPSRPLQSLALAVRTQVDLLPHGDPGQESLRALHDYARLTDDVAACAAAALFGVGASFRTGTIADVRRATDELRQVAGVMPRPDLRWTITASSAAMELAAGSLAAAGSTMDEAVRYGESAHVGLATPVHRLQTSLATWQRAELGSLADLLVGLADRDDAAPLTMCFAGLALAQAGDEAGAAEVLERILGRPRPLDSSGLLWPAVAALLAQLVWSCRSRPVGEARLDGIVGPLRRRHGQGLAVHGVAYLGPVDLALALLGLPSPLGDPGPRALRAIADVEHARGMTWWANHAAARAEAW